MIICNVFLDSACVVKLSSVQPSLATAPVRRTQYLPGPFNLSLSTQQ